MTAPVKASVVLPVAAVVAGGSALAYLWLADRQKSAVRSALTAGGDVKLRLTGYWPFTATAAERRMEGGIFDRKMPSKYKDQPDSPQYKAHVLRTVEDFISGKSDFVSLSGDDAIWPYGQKIIIPWFDREIVGRVVDTGGHFRGLGKVIRLVGHEPIDVAVHSKDTKVPRVVTGRIVAGDSFEGGRAVAYSKLAQEHVVGEGYSDEDCEALARALESAMSVRSVPERRAIAWVVRNRAARLGQSVRDLLAPRGDYGTDAESGGYLSTRLPASDPARAIAVEVLSAEPSSDPTGGGCDFWVPRLQDMMASLGDAHRAAVAAGDSERAKKFAAWAPYTADAEDVRRALRDRGVGVLKSIGLIEIVAKKEA